MPRLLAIASVILTALAVLLLWRAGAKKPDTDAPEVTAPAPVPAADAAPAPPSPARRGRPRAPATAASPTAPMRPSVPRS